MRRGISPRVSPEFLEFSWVLTCPFQGVLKCLHNAVRVNLKGLTPSAG